MPISRHSARPLAVLGLALSLVLLTTAAASAGFLDSLFHGDRHQDQPTALPYADTSTPPPAFPATPSAVTAAPSVTQPPSGTGGGYGSVATFCVRLCDGRFFPVQRHASATPIQMCSAFCPAAKTKVFTGSEIANARAADGARYADLDNAFVYRQKVVPDCSCNGRDAFGLARIDVTNDPTLRAGDIIVTAQGPQKYSGSQAQLRKGAGFSPVQLGDAASQRHRIATTGVATAN
jgi:hypothetical protein